MFLAQIWFGLDGDLNFLLDMRCSHQTVKKLQDLLRQVAVLGAKVLRKDVEKVIGLLI